MQDSTRDSSAPTALATTRRPELLRVFISSTSVDLHAHRAALKATIEKMDQAVIAMESFGAQPYDATTVSRAEVAKADVFVLVVAWRYGYVPKGETRSVTHLEYLEALERKIPILVFLADPSTETQTGPNDLFPAALRDYEHHAQVMAFRAEVSGGKGFVRDFFTTPDNLAANVAAALSRLLHEPFLPYVRDLAPESLKLGSDHAARFPYVVAPVREQFETTVQALEASAEGSRETLGVLVVGEPSAGKTRLAYEALVATLPDWRLLRWSPARTSADILSPQVLHGQRIVIFLDDLQAYGGGVGGTRGEGGLVAPIGPVQTMRDMVETVRGNAARAVIVATCRSGQDLSSARASLNWLMGSLTQVDVPTFSADKRSPEAAAIIAQFAARGQVRDEWNGTLGSLVLGLAEVQAQYDQLRTAHSPAIPVLRAMKLLTRCGITDHTERRLRVVCTTLFGQVTTTAEWQAAVEDLTQHGFVREEPSDEDSTQLALQIRKDEYLERIVPDYDDPARPALLAQDRQRLRGVLAEIKDKQGLIILGAAFYILKLYAETLAAAEGALHVDSTNSLFFWMKGIALNALNRPTEALDAFEHALALDANNANYWSGKGAALNALNRPTEALDAFEHALALDSSDSYAWNGKGAALNALDRPTEALDAFKFALVIDPTLAIGWYNTGHALYRLGQPARALVAFEQALLLDPTYAVAWSGKANSLRGLKRPAEALDAFEYALALDPNNVSYWRGKGTALSDLKRDEEALTAFEHALELNPNDAESWSVKGAKLAGQRRPAEALEAFAHALALDPGDWFAWFGRGGMLMDLGRPDDALEAFTHSLTLDSTKHESWYGKGRALAGLGRPAEALIAYGHALELDPAYSDAWESKGDALLALKRPVEALVAYEQALTVEPANAVYWNGKGRALEELKDYAGAASAYRRAAELAADKKYIWSNLAEMLLRPPGHAHEALEASQRATQLDPSSVRGWRLMGDALRQLGRKDEAAASYERAVRLDAAGQLALYNRGLALAGLGLFAEAVVIYDQVLKLDPEDEDAQRAKVEAELELGHPHVPALAASRPRRAPSGVAMFALALGWVVSAAYWALVVANVAQLAGHGSLPTAQALSLPLPIAQPLWLDAVFVLAAIAVSFATIWATVGTVGGMLRAIKRQGQ